jgi:hypothetical protein
LVAASREVEGIDLAVVDTVAGRLPLLPGADGLELHRAPLEQARLVVEARALRSRRQRRMHFLTAGRGGFEATGLPPSLIVAPVPGACAPAVAEHALGRNDGRHHAPLHREQAAASLGRALRVAPSPVPRMRR